MGLWAVTCFSKALGTSLLSSDRLWLIRSLRLFSMIYRRRAEGQSAPTKATKKITIQGYNPLTPLLFFRARICEALPGDMDPVTGLYHGEIEREKKWGMALAQREALWFSIHIVIITLLNMTQRQDGTSAPFNLICFLGTEQRRSARERREDEIVFGLMRFWTLVSVKWHAVLLSIWAKALLERWLYSLGAPACSMGSSELLRVQSLNMDCVCLWTLVLQAWKRLTAWSSLQTAPPKTYCVSIRF